MKKVILIAFYFNQVKKETAIHLQRSFGIWPETVLDNVVRKLYGAKYGDEAECINSFISDGCVIEGTVINSILSRGGKVGKGAIVRNSVIMQDSVIEDGAEISHVVFDKEVVITSGRKLIGQDTHPLPIAKGTVI